MEVSFLFLDESDNRDMRVSSLTGLLLPVDKYGSLRSDFYEVILRIVYRGKRFIDPDIPELHGSDLLRKLDGADDELRFRVSEEAVRLIIEYQVEVFRAGYRVTDEAATAVKSFGLPMLSFIKGVCFATLINTLQDRLATGMIIPIMDGFDQATVNGFSRLIKNMDLMRAMGWQAGMSIKHSENILGEVFYADSSFSILTQLADMVSYLRTVADLSKTGEDMSTYKKRLLEISHGLSASMKYEEIGSLDLKTGKS